MAHKAPDSPGPDSVDDELNEPTRDSMDRLGEADLVDEPDDEARETTDRTTPGQNSDWLPQ